MIKGSVQLLRVFVNAEDKFGDLASVVIDEGKKISDKKRQEIAKQLHTGETIFINDIEKAKISVMHSQGEIDFAGVGVLGAAYYLSKLRSKSTEILHGRNGEITCWQDGELQWNTAPLKIMPLWDLVQRVSKLEIEPMKVEYTKDVIHTMFWAWMDKDKGLIRARTFANDWNIPEAEGNGSGAMLLAAKLDREIKITHGKGSIIFAKPYSNEYASIGGRVVQDATVLL